MAGYTPPSSHPCWATRKLNQLQQMLHRPLLKKLSCRLCPTCMRVARRQCIEISMDISSAHIFWQRRIPFDTDDRIASHGQPRSAGQLPAVAVGDCCSRQPARSSSALALAISGLGLFASHSVARRYAYAADIHSTRRLPGLYSLRRDVRTDRRIIGHSRRCGCSCQRTVRPLGQCVACIRARMPGDIWLGRKSRRLCRSRGSPFELTRLLLFQPVGAGSASRSSA